MTPRSRSPRRAVALVAAALAVAALCQPGVAAGSPGGTPVMGPAQLSAAQIAAAYARTGRTPVLSVTVAELAELYLEEGAAEGVRGDLAFAQAVLETGWFATWGAVPSGANNFAGMGATGGGAPGHVFATPRLGVRAHVQHLRFLADPTATPERLANPPESRWWVVDPPGKAPTVEQLSGCVWACDSAYASKVLSVYRSLGGAAGAPTTPAPTTPAPTTPAPTTPRDDAPAPDPRIAPRMPDGLVVRDAADRVWWLDDGEARPVRSAAVLASWGVRDTRVLPARAGETARRRPGPALDWRPGTLLRLPDETLALFDGAALRPVAEDLLDARGHRTEAIVDARPGDVAGIATGEPVDDDDLVVGEVVRFGDDDEMFEVAADGLLTVDDPVLLYARYGGGDVVATRPADAERPEVVGTVAFRDGSVLHTPDGKVWLVSAGERRHVRSPKTLRALRLPVGAVLAVDEDLAERHDEGEPLEP